MWINTVLISLILICSSLSSSCIKLILETGCGREACLVPAMGCLGIALPLSTTHFPLGKKQSIEKSLTVILTNLVACSCFHRHIDTAGCEWVEQVTEDGRGSTTRDQRRSSIMLSGCVRKVHTYLTLFSIVEHFSRLLLVFQRWVFPEECGAAFPWRDLQVHRSCWQP